jgi:hypothetical protein
MSADGSTLGNNISVIHKTVWFFGTYDGDK